MPMDLQEYSQEDSYLGNMNVKRVGVPTAWTPDMVTEYQKCMESPVYFIEKYMKIINLDNGLINFAMYPYQKEMVDHIHDNRFSIILASRQSGKSITTIGYMLWFALFHSEKTLAILANKGDTARELLARLQTALENVPFFLQPGTKELNKGSIKFGNNSKIIARATSNSSIRGQSISLLYLDEFAFIDNAEIFYTSTYPVITSGKSTKVIITSTANGIGNPFYYLYQGAVTKTNTYAPYRVDWWNVPGRDEAWKKETIANTSELQFQQEFANDFLGTGNTLLNAGCIMGMKALDPIWINETVRLYEQPIPGRRYIIAVDVAKGRGQDHSAFSIIDITESPFRQVGTLYDNMVSPMLLPNLLWKYAKMFNQAYVVIENNDQGAMVCNILYYDIEYENVYVNSNTKGGMNISAGPKSFGLGIYMDRKTKRIGCSNLKDLIEEGKLIIQDKNTIMEFTTFIASGQSYEADEGHHDDLIMALVVFAWFATTLFFREMTDSQIKDILYLERMKQIEDQVTPFGIIDEGHEEETIVDKQGQLWNIAKEEPGCRDDPNDEIFKGWQ